MLNICTTDFATSAFGVAPSNQPQQTKTQKFKQAALKYLCGTSPENKVLQSAVDEGLKGSITGALGGLFGGGVFTEGLAAVPGAGVGAFVGGVLGTTSGIINGAEVAAVCSAFHVY